MSSKGYLIDSARCLIREVTYNTADDMRKLIGGYLEVASTLSNGDVLYVDEEGLLKSGLRYFLFSLRPDQVLAGNGLLVGEEVHDGDGEYLGMRNPKTSFQRLCLMVDFVENA